MKLVGFIKELDNLAEASPFSSIRGNQINDIDLVLKIVNYLSSGIMIMSWMGYFKDLESDLEVSPHSYASDGVWVWPSYFEYYLSKYVNYDINKEFLTYLVDKQFKPGKIMLNEEAFEMELLRKLNPSF